MRRRSAAAGGPQMPEHLCEQPPFTGAVVVDVPRWRAWWWARRDWRAVHEPGRSLAWIHDVALYSRLRTERIQAAADRRSS